MCSKFCVRLCVCVSGSAQFSFLLFFFLNPCYGSLLNCLNNKGWTDHIEVLNPYWFHNTNIKSLFGSLSLIWNACPAKITIYLGLVLLIQYVCKKKIIYICCLCCRHTPSQMAGQRIGVFSYGSGFAATLYSLRVTQDHIPGKSYILQLTCVT